MRTGILRRVAVLLCAIGAWPAAPVHAHDFSRSESLVVVRGNEAHVQLQVDLIGFAGLQWRGGDAVAYGELDDRIDRIYGLVKEHFRLESSVPLAATSLDRYELVDNHVLRMDLVVRFAREVPDLAVISTLDEVTQVGHLHLARITIDGQTRQAVLTAAAPTLRFDRDTSAGTTAWNMFRLGGGHVFRGADHLVFLVAVAVGAPTVLSLVPVFLSFLLADGVAVALADSGAVLFRPSSIDTLVTLTIAAMAAANLLGARRTDRSVVAALFACVHSLGFAGALRDMALSRGSLALSLGAFDGGVELAHVAVVAAVFPLARVGAAHWRHFRPAVSVAAGGLAVYWFVRRFVPS